jgi:hypothetical protein
MAVAATGRDKRQQRRARKRAAAIAAAEAALAIQCPTCGAVPGVWCFVRRHLGPDMHERRYNAATSTKEA